MGQVTYADGIAILQIIYYIPALPISIFLLIRWKSFAWFFLSLFCTLRIIGGIARVLTISNPDSNGIWTTALICSILGLSPLLMATLTLVGRALRAFVKPQVVMIVILAVHAPAGLAVALSIIGATDASSAATIGNEDKVKIGVCLYIPVVAALGLLEVFCFMKNRSSGDKGERQLILALLAALPFIAIRLLYGLLTIFSNGGVFAIQYGNETAALLMAVLEEMVVVLIYLAVGLKLPAQKPQEQEGYGRNLAPKERSQLPREQR